MRFKEDGHLVLYRHDLLPEHQDGPPLSLLPEHFTIQVRQAATMVSSLYTVTYSDDVHLVDLTKWFHAVDADLRRRHHTMACELADARRLIKKFNDGVVRVVEALGLQPSGADFDAMIYHIERLRLRADQQFLQIVLGSPAGLTP